MDDKTELPKLKRSWIFTRIGELLFLTSIIGSFGWLAVYDHWEAQHPGEGGNLWGLAWIIVSVIAWVVIPFITLIGFVIDCFRNRQKVVSVKKYKTNLIVWFCIWPIFFFGTFSSILSVSYFILEHDPPDILTGFGLSVLAAWFVGNLYRQTTKEVEQN